MTAVAAFPHLDLGLLKDFLSLDVVQQGTVALLMHLLDGGNATELCGELGEALLLGDLGKLIVHVGPLEVLALGSGCQVLGGGADAAEFLEPHLGVGLLVVSGLQEQCGNLLQALLLRHGCEVGVLVACLGFARKGFLQVFLGLGASVLVCHKMASF